MKGFALFLLFIAVCFTLTHVMINDHGYVLLAYNDMSFESSLWGLLLLIALIVGIFMLGKTLLSMLLGMLGVVYPISAQARQRKARRLFDRGLAEFTKGHWKKAEKLLAQAASSGEAPLINYLAAARAAHEAGNEKASATYLRQADSHSPGAEMAISITQAQIQLSGNHLEQALATLKHLHQKYPRHAYILKLLKEVYVRLNDWQALANLLPKLRKFKVISEDKFHELEQQAFDALFEQAYQRGRNQSSPEEQMKPVHQVWNGMTSAQKKDPVILYRYADIMVRLSAEKKAEQLLRQNLTKHYSEPLIRLYGKIKGGDIQKQLRFAETLISERTNDPELLLTLGRLALRNELWGKAKEYLEASLRLRKSVDVYNELGQLLASLDDFETSTRYFQEGLLLAADNVAGLPHPRSS